MTDNVLKIPIRFPDSVEEMTPDEAFVCGAEWSAFCIELSLKRSTGFNFKAHPVTLKSILKEVEDFKKKNPEYPVYPVIDDKDDNDMFIVRIFTKPPLMVVGKKD